MFKKEIVICLSSEFCHVSKLSLLLNSLCTLPDVKHLWHIRIVVKVSYGFVPGLIIVTSSHRILGGMEQHSKM
jgi:hypothetical protein